MMEENIPPANELKRILILSADAGFGHRSAALALQAAFAEKYADCCDVQLLNPLNDRRTPAVLRDSQADYDRMITNIPKIYQIGYDALDAAVPTALLESATTVLLYEVIQDILRSYQPAAVITTYPLYQAPLAAVISLDQLDIPLITVITDLVTVHRIWFNKNADLVTVATPELEALAVESGILKERIHTTGIPVHPKIAREKRSKAEIRTALGWDIHLPTFLAVGSRRIEKMIDALRVLNHFGQPLQIVAVAGNDEELYQELQAMDWHVPVHLYEFTEEIPAMMSAADALICKAGGLITTEALASGLPLLLVEYIAGQESGNVEYVVENGAGDLAESPLEILEVVSHWLQNDAALLKTRAENACKLGKAQAAYTIAELVWAEIKPHRPRKQLESLARQSLTDLLNRHQVPWEKT